MFSWTSRLMPLIAAGTRRMQASQPNRPIRGLTRFSNLLDRVLPPFQGIAQLTDGIRMELDSRESAQRSLLFAGCYQTALTHVLRQHTPEGGYCLDVGANLGFYTLAFAAWTGVRGRVASFEANPALVELISHNVGLNHYKQVEILQQAVHNEPGGITFYVAEALGKSSVLESHVPEPVQRLMVDAITIDGYVQSRGWERLDVMKLDIEGNDCTALLGARESLLRFRPFVVFEYWYNTPQHIAEAALGLLQDVGYNLRLLLTDGEQIPFDWRQPVSNRRSVDVVAQFGNL